MSLNEFYRGLEDWYYEFMDSLEEKGWKPYERFVDPIENKGIPSFPIACFLVLVLVAGVGFAVYSVFNGSTPTTTLTVSVSSGSALVDGVRVVISYDGQTQASQTKNGVAKFEVPANKKVIIRLSKEGFETVTREVDVGLQSNSISLSLTPADVPPSDKPSLVLFVSDESGVPVADALATFRNPSSGEVSSRTTDATGRVKLELDQQDSPLFFTVKKQGFKDSTKSCSPVLKTCEVKMSRSTARPTAEPEVKGSVRVEVADTAGVPQKARVTLKNAEGGKTFSADNTDRDGVVFFEKVAEKGASVYVVVEPDSPDLLYYNGAENEYEVRVETLIKVKLESKARANVKTVSVKAIDKESNKTVQGAEVTLFLATQPLRPFSTNKTDVRGVAEFVLAQRVYVYGTVNARGYLPERTRSLTAGDATDVLLTKVVPGNNGRAKVTVTDDDDTPVELADVQLVSKDGFSSGVYSKQSAADGVVFFEELPLLEYKAMATLGSRKGVSDIFRITLDADAEAVVKLEPTKATVAVTTYEVGSTRPVAATISALYNDEQYASCATNSTAATCSLKVLANKPFKLKAAAVGYAETTSEEITLGTSELSKKTLYLLPSSMASTLSIVNARVEDLNGRNMTRLDRAGTYKLLLTFNLPSTAKSAGAFIRVGDKPVSADDNVKISSFDKPGDANIITSTAYSQTGCANDAALQSEDAAKWVQYTFKNNSFGVRTVAVTIQVKPSASPKESINVYYRVFAEKGGTMLRVPADADLGDKLRTDAKDYCYANSNKLSFKINDGLTTCNDKACIATTFTDGNNTKTNGLQTKIDAQVTGRIAIRSAVQLSNPSLRITAASPVKMLNANFGSDQPLDSNEVSVSLDQADDKNGSILFKAITPSQQAKLKFELSDSGEPVLAAERYVVIQGTGRLLMAVTPLTVEANKNTQLTATLMTQSGEAITDAKLALEESAEKPLDGQLDGPITLLGDNTENKGVEGRYKLSVSPVTIGRLKLTAKRTGFADALQEINVTAPEVLEFSQDLSQIDVGCTPVDLTVTTSLNTELKVFASFADNACAAITGGRATSSGYAFTVKPEKETKLKITAKNSTGSCILTFNARTPSGTFAGTVDAFVNTQCGSPTSCSSQNCLACTAAECASLSPYCTVQNNACVSNSSTINRSQCIPPNFNFQDLFKNRLVGELYNQGLRPDYDEQGNPFDPDGRQTRQVNTNTANALFELSLKGFEVKSAGTCSGSGTSLTCTKTINPITPFTAFAFTVLNLLPGQTEMNVQSSDPNCFKLSDGSLLATFDQLVQGSVPQNAATGAVPPLEGKTFVVYFDPSCAQYDANFNVKPKSSQTQITLRAAQTQQSQQATITLSVTADNSMARYAFVTSPAKEFTYRTGKIEEPLYYANNIHAPLKVTVNGQDALTGELRKATLSDEKITIIIGGQTITRTLGKKQVNSLLKTKYDVVGNPVTSGDCLDNFCSENAAKAFVLSSAAQAAKVINAEVERLNTATGSITGGAALGTPYPRRPYQDPYAPYGQQNPYPYQGSGLDDSFGRAAQQAMMDMIILQNAYRQCLAMGVDPLANNSNYCTPGQGNAPYYGGYPYVLSNSYYPQNSYYQNPYAQPYSQYANNPYYDGVIGNTYGSTYSGLGCDPYLLNPYTQPYGQQGYAQQSGQNYGYGQQYQLTPQYFNQPQRQLQQQIAKANLQIAKGTGPELISGFNPRITFPVRRSGPKAGVYAVTVAKSSSETFVENPYVKTDDSSASASPSPGATATTTPPGGGTPTTLPPTGGTTSPATTTSSPTLSPTPTPSPSAGPPAPAVAPAPAPATTTSCTVEPANPTICQGNSLQFTVTCTPSSPCVVKTYEVPGSAGSITRGGYLTITSGTTDKTTTVTAEVSPVKCSTQVNIKEKNVWNGWGLWGC